MVPLCLYRDAVAQGRYSYIICTQPRRFAASELAERVAHLLGEEVGQTVGYRIGGDTQENYEKTRILFVTTGYLLENLSHRRQGGLWSRATHIVLDEVHERSLESDAMMLVIRLLLQQEDDEGVAHHRAKRLILMSATISMTLFQNYFSSLSYPTISGPERRAAQRAATSRAGSILARPLSATVLAGERPKTVSVDFLSDIIADVQQRIPGFPSDALNTLKSYAVRADRAKPFAALQLSPKEVESMCQLILSYAKPSGCILVFLPGLKEIEDFFQAITDLGQISDSLSPRLFQLHSIIPHIDQKRIFVPAASNECKIILSTNIAETSVTIKDVTVVVDLGFVRRVVYDKKKNAKIIRIQWCSRAASTQRMGRAGRVTDGRNLRFYTEHVYKNLMTEFDESVLFPLEAPILKFRLHFAHLGAVEELFAQLIESPAKENVSQALSRLVRFGALGPAPEYEVLNFGRIAADLPVDIKFSRAIVLASRYGLAGEIAVIAAGHVLTYSLYQLPRRTACKSDAHFQAWMLETFESMHHFDGGRCSDPLQFLSIMEEVLAIRGEQKRRTFCFRNKLDYQQVAWLIKTTTSICNRIRESTALASLTFTAEDADLMDALRNPATHQGVKFASLGPESCTVEYLEVVLTACADSMLGGVLAAPSMDEDLADPKHFSSKKDHKTALSWVQSQQKDVILFSGITESVYDAGEAVFKECLRCFGASSVVFLEQSHGGMAAAVQIPKILDENFAVRSALKTSPRVNAICRMNMLHTTKKWSFSSANGNHLVILPHPETSNTVVEWRSFNLAAERQLWEQSSEDEFCSEEEYSHDDDYNCEEESEQYDESDEDEQYQDEGGSGEDVFHWRHRLLVDKWSSVGSYFIGDQSSNPALLGVAFSLTYMGHTPIATCNFLLPTQESQNVLSFLAALVHLPPTLTVTLGKRRNTSDVTIKELFTADKQVNDVLRLLRPPISPILLLELNLHRLSLHMLTDAFTRSDYQLLGKVRVLLRSLRKKADKTFVPLTRDGHLEQVVELTSHIAEASPHVESGHDLLIFVDIDPLEEVAEIARCPHWRSAVTEYRQCMKMLEAGERVRVSMQSDEPNKHSSATKERGTTWAGSLSPTAIDVRAAVVVPPAATTKPLPNERPTTRKNVVPREFRLDGQVVPIDRLLRNQFVTDCIQSGTNVGRLCTNHRQHSRMTCRFAHFDRYAMKQGSDVSGSDVLDNVALKVLRNNSNFTGSFCTKGHCPNPMQCTYLHRK
ncbi:ATP-dependent RNA helicase, putative [Bodo saltans]|uniref:ATP-dependent RNA helicase, putative n=1 Tax=Bodo saltans TaxID=75058 RepID=A0A0S4JFJ8_BODSA|nr:ATP-dependent RNA helicase, putative [Bodo saltans]|eukprot:CUG90189.1 ATP-dependent RNA helicase, putative [Bodo saltans]